MDITINGKRVTLRDKIPARLGWEKVVGKADQYQRPFTEIPFDDLAALMTVAVESWEFTGDPAAAQSYESLDLVNEFMPLANELGGWLSARFSTPKN
jgi:hypothetical protein